VPNHDHHSPHSIAAIAQGFGLTASTAGDVPEALRMLAEEGAPLTVLIVGTLYLAGEVLAANDEAPD
jgi:dihydrofolate synthase/folylpolyglutamate synthase